MNKDLFYLLRKKYIENMYSVRIEIEKDLSSLSNSNANILNDDARMFGFRKLHRLEVFEKFIDHNDFITDEQKELAITLIKSEASFLPSNIIETYYLAITNTNLDEMYKTILLELNIRLEFMFIESLAKTSGIENNQFDYLFDDVYYKIYNIITDNEKIDCLINAYKPGNAINEELELFINKTEFINNKMLYTNEDVINFLRDIRDVEVNERIIPLYICEEITFENNTNEIKLVGDITNRGIVVGKNHQGIPFATFTIGVKRIRSELKDYINVVAWRNLAEYISNLKPNSKIELKGRLQTRTYQDANGKSCYTTEILASEVNKLNILSTRNLGKVFTNSIIKKNTVIEKTNENLEDLIGLGLVKKDLNNVINMVKMQKLRKEQGKKNAPLSLHLVFTGNPGTGKTTVARILSQIYKNIGILSKGHLVEVDRGDLVAAYLGQTAIKTKEKIKEAMGGILFIDEAYSLVNGDNDSYGKEAIDTILKEMEDNRDDLVVIVAGYPELMKRFINSNPGLKSRFNKYMSFEDYSVNELYEIFIKFCEKNEYVLEEDAKGSVYSYLVKLIENKDENFANARDVRNYFENIIVNQANRILSSDNTNNEDITLIKKCDVENL